MIYAIKSLCQITENSSVSNTDEQIIHYSKISRKLYCLISYCGLLLTSPLRHSQSCRNCRALLFQDQSHSVHVVSSTIQWLKQEQLEFCSIKTYTHCEYDLRNSGIHRNQYQIQGQSAIIFISDLKACSWLSPIIKKNPGSTIVWC